MRTLFCTLVAFGLASLLAAPALAQDKKDADKKDVKDEKKDKKAKKPSGTFTDPKDAGLDYVVQGEYVGAVDGGGKLGCQIIALGSSSFQAVILPGGLPGDGWDGAHKILMDGSLDSDKVDFVPTTGKRKYMAGSPKEFSATTAFPPKGHKDYSGTLVSDTMVGKTDDGKTFKVKKVVRESQTLGAKAPAGAIVLFDGKDASKWKENRIVDGLLPVEANTKDKFGDFKLHLEFMTPLQPAARDQGRGNSGVYLHGKEIQVLDSFGLAGKNNECGGIYSEKEPKVNMCYPPLTWQTYDVDIVTQMDEKTKKPATKITVLHNGVVIHENVNWPSSPGPIHLQNHGNPVVFRNIWLVETKSAKE